MPTSIYARRRFVLGLCAWGIPRAMGFSKMTSCRLQSNYRSMLSHDAVHFGHCHGNHFLACYIWGAHWHHPANTTRPSMCGGDAALCQIILTTCCYIIKPHDTMYVNVACCYKQNVLSICQSLLIVSPTKTAKLIKML